MTFLIFGLPLSVVKLSARSRGPYIIPREARFPQHNTHFKIESDEYVRMYVRMYDV